MQQHLSAFFPTFFLDQSSQDLHEELKNVLTLFSEKKRNLEIVKTPEVFISQTSDPQEVQNWLRAKGFSDR
jgi:epidermal growth factor receptor kinase substrate 8